MASAGEKVSHATVNSDGGRNAGDVTLLNSARYGTPPAVGQVNVFKLLWLLRKPAQAVLVGEKV